METSRATHMVFIGQKDNEELRICHDFKYFQNLLGCKVLMCDLGVSQNADSLAGLAARLGTAAVLKQECGLSPFLLSPVFCKKNSSNDPSSIHNYNHHEVARCPLPLAAEGTLSVALKPWGSLSPSFSAFTHLGKCWLWSCKASTIHIALPMISPCGTY